MSTKLHKLLFLAVFVVAILSTTPFVNAAYPSTPFEPSDNVQDPGNIPIGLGGGSCGPSDTNCYVSLPTTGIPNLQQVTDAGNVTTNSIQVNAPGTERYIRLLDTTPVYNPIVGVDMPIAEAALWMSNKYGITKNSGVLTLGANSFFVDVIPSETLSNFRAITLPDGDGNITLSVNGVFADDHGDIDLPMAVSIAGTSNNTLYSSGLSGTGTGDLSGGNNIFLGVNAGNGATNAATSLFLGNAAGQGATDTSNGIFFGDHAGYGALNANSGTFIGSYSGYEASYAVGSSFFGENAGYQATYAEESNFIGPSAGYQATYAAKSNFFGNYAGSSAANATFSDFIGYSAGSNDTVDNTSNNLTDSCENPYHCYSILIGPNTSTGGHSNSIAFGAYATNTNSNQIMIGSPSRRIEEMVFNGGSGNTCSIITGTGISCSSDKRLKTNIEELPEDTLDKVLELRTVTYNWKTDPSGDQMIGFIAQNLNDYFPQLVSHNTDGMLSVNYANMAPILTKAIQEMNLNITDLSNLGRENTWRDAFIQWFADTKNGITDFVAERIQADRADLRELCLDDVCVTKEELQALLDGAQNATSSSTDAPSSDTDIPDDTISSETETSADDSDDTEGDANDGTANPETEVPEIDIDLSDGADDTEDTDTTTDTALTL